MKSYQFFIDLFLPGDFEYENPMVVDGVVEAENAEAARDAAYERLKAGEIEDAPEDYTDYYVWEVSEDDVVEED